MKVFTEKGIEMVNVAETAEDAIKAVIGEAYIEQPNSFFDNAENVWVEKCYREIAKVNSLLFEQIPFEVVFTEDDPYTSSKQMRKEVMETGIMRIFSGESDSHKYLTEEENNISRAVHDCWAHMVCGCPFSFKGEYNAYLEQRKYYPEWTWKVLFAEIPAQTAAYYYKKDFDFPQRAVEAPQEWLDVTYFHMKHDYSKNSVLSPLSFTNTQISGDDA